MPNFRLFLCLLYFLIAASSLFAQEINVALHKPVAVSSEDGNSPAFNITDGRISRNHAWMSHASVRPPHQVTINLKQYCDVNRVVIYSGIPETEKKNAEKGQAPGFWSVKNMRMQYWDDANWTDLPQTEIYENRKDTILFRFKPALTTFQFRLISTDGEPIRINEIEIFGTVKKNMPLPDAPEAKEQPYAEQAGENIRISVYPETTGKSMKYVAYNQGYFVPGCNASDWLRYSNVNSLRVWASLNDYVPVSCISADEQVNSLSRFEVNKQMLRNNPEHNTFIRWEQIIPVCETIMYGTNATELRYALEETKRLGIDVVLQINDRNFNNNWSNKWQQWQRFYALAYYAAKTGDVSMFAMQNEPNHHAAGPMKIETYISGLQIVSDAVHCAVEDVNKRYGKKLTAKILSPITAGTNIDWWVEVMKNIRTHYSGKPGNRDLIDIFSTHAYNLPASGYATKVSEIRELITENHPQKKSLPIVFTETGRWMNAHLIDKYETMDSPSLFTEWAGEYTNNTLNGCYGMWAFKMANTASGTYPRGIKSGHHLTWQGQRIVEDAYLNIAKDKPVFDRTSGTPVKIAGICDGDKSDSSAWLSPLTNNDKYLEIDLGKMYSIGGAVVYTGSAYGVFTGPDRVKNFKLQYMKENEWIDIEETVQKGAKYVQSFFIFNTRVETDKVRFVSTDAGSIKIREIKLFDAASMKNIQPSYSISGIHRTGEVIRLFAKGFKDERPLLKTTVSSPGNRDTDVMVSYDNLSGVYYIWLVQRKIVCDTVTIDLSRLNIGKDARVIAEEVSGKNYGNVTMVKSIDNNRSVSLKLPAQSVMLLTIPAKGSQNYREITSAADATVQGGRFAKENYGNLPEVQVEMHAARPEDNRIGYMRFDLNRIDRDKLQAAILKISAHTTSSAPFRLHVYATENTGWKEDRINRDNAPQLSGDVTCSWVSTGSDTFLAGEMVAGMEQTDCAIDVTDILRRIKGKSITFIFIRELRQLGDDADNGEQFIISSRESADKPVLMTW
ncbi:MAG: discoidin domain-containing protein [Paludibacter sp.]|nr:discoidin domain-containing protein [Paludibacter sp.]